MHARHPQVQGVYYCIHCRRHLLSSAFAPSSLARYVHRCRRCQVTRSLQARNLSPAHKAAHCLYELERRRYGSHGKLISVQLVQRILDRFAHRSIISGESAGWALRLRRFWPHLPFSECNVAVVTARENNALARTKDWIARFPPAFVQQMRQQNEPIVTSPLAGAR